MKNQGKATVFVFVTVLMLLMSSPAFCEWSGDIYLGMHSSQADDASIKFNGAIVKTYADPDTGSIFGGCIGLAVGFRGNRHRYRRCFDVADGSSAVEHKRSVSKGKNSALFRCRSRIFLWRYVGVYTGSTSRWKGFG